MNSKKASVKEKELKKVDTNTTESPEETKVEETKTEEKEEVKIEKESEAPEKEIETTEEKEESTVEEVSSDEKSAETSVEKEEETSAEADTDTKEDSTDSEDSETSDDGAKTETKEVKEPKKTEKASKEVDTNTEEETEPASEKEEKPKKKIKFTMNEGLWLLLGLVAGILVGYLILQATVMTAINKMSSGNSTEATSGSTSDSTETTDGSDDDTETIGITTYEYDSTIISDEDEVKAVQDKVKEFTDSIANNNTYAQVQTGSEQYSYYLYNSNGEMFTQDSDNLYTEIFLNDGTVYKYNSEDESLSVGADTEITSIMNNAINAVGSDGVTLYKMTLDDDDSDTTDEEYRVDLVGRDAVKLLYSNMSDEFADIMVDTMIESLSTTADDSDADETDEESTEESTEASTETDTSTTEEWEPHIIMVFYLTGDYLTSYSYCMFVMDGSEYTNWVLQGVDSVGSWSLDEGWYSYDPESDEDGATFTTLTTSLITDVNAVMSDYAEANGYDLSDYYEDDEETTETVDTETTEE
jgi:hypothetical protein